MTLSDRSELNRAEEYIDKGHFYKALQVLTKPEIKIDDSSKWKVLFNHLKSICLNMLGQDEEALQLAQDVYQTYKETNDLLGMFKSSIIIAESLAWLGKQEKAFEVIINGDNLLKKIPTSNLNALGSIKATFYCIKSMIYSRKGEVDNAVCNMDRSIALGEQYSNVQDLTRIFYNYGYVLFMRGELIKALKYFEKALSFGEEDFNRYKTRLNSAIGSVKMEQGYLEQALFFYNQALEMATKMDCKRDIAGILHNIGELYHFMGDLSQSQANLKQSLEILENLDATSVIVNVIYSLIRITLESGDPEQCERYLNYLKEIKNKESTKEIDFFFHLSMALLLKESPRLSKRGKAEEILKQILDDEDISLGVNERALLTLCELLLVEFQMTNEVEVLDELESCLTHLSEIAEKSRSYWILCETYLLRAKMSLLSYELEEARRLLAKGQKIAEKYGLKLLAIKISNEHDGLLKQLNMWENLKLSTSSLKERIELTRLNEQMNDMIRKRVVEPNEIKEEESVVILIISEGGSPIFSQSFVEGWNFQDHLFGGFLSAVNSFSDEIFSQGLDRAVFGEYTVIMNAVSPFIVCYLFKGQSFLAQEKMKIFIDSIQNDKKIWESIIKYYQANRFVQLKDIPSLDLLVNEIFIKRVV